MREEVKKQIDKILNDAQDVINQGQKVIFELHALRLHLEKEENEKNN